MNTQRTGGMTTMAVLNIVFGALGTLGAMLLVLGGGFIAAAGTAMESEMGTEAEGLGAMAAAGGGIMLLIGLVWGAVNIMLIFSGVGILKLAPWGRTLSIVCGAGYVLLNLVSLFFNGFGLGVLVGLAYGGTLLTLCFSETWKFAFAGVSAPGSFDAADATPGFAPMPTTPGPDANASNMTPEVSGMSTAPTEGMPSQIPAPGFADNPAPAAEVEESGFSGMPGIPSAPANPNPGASQQGNEDMSSAA